MVSAVLSLLGALEVVADSFLREEGGSTVVAAGAFEGDEEDFLPVQSQRTCLPLSLRFLRQISH